MSQARVNNTHGAGNTLSPARAAGLRRERTPTQDDTRATTTPSGSGGIIKREGNAHKALAFAEAEADSVGSMTSEQ
jgi:hypothetical protein